MKCEFCNSPAREAARYCRDCGASLGDAKRTSTIKAASPIKASNMSPPSLSGKPPAFWISIVGFGAILAILAGVLISPSAAYNAGYRDWNTGVSGRIYADMKWGGMARQICEAYGSYMFYSGKELRDYTQGCIDGFNDANP